MFYVQTILASFFILSGVMQLLALWRPALARPWPMPPKLSTISQSRQRYLFIIVWSAQAFTVILPGLIVGFGAFFSSVLTFVIGVLAAGCALIVIVNRSILPKT